METVLITGAARRLGRLIAKDLSASGCFVWIHYRSHNVEAFALRDDIIAGGGQCDCVGADLTDTGQIDSMLRHIQDSEHGKLTALINNASVFPAGTILDTSADLWDRVIDTNLKAVWYLSARFAECFPSAKRIITIGDASVSKGYADHAVYGLSKYALKYLTGQMAEAFAPAVRVNLLSPGLVLQGDRESDESWKQRVENLPVSNSGIVDAVLQGVRFLMSDPGMTGSELMIDNGLHLHG